MEPKAHPQIRYEWAPEVKDSPHGKGPFAFVSHEGECIRLAHLKTGVHFCVHANTVRVDPKTVPAAKPEQLAELQAQINQWVEQHAALERRVVALERALRKQTPSEPTKAQEGAQEAS